MATETKEETTGPARASVHPGTLGIRDLVTQGATVAGVYGGAEGTVWCATFADPGEAQAWILASNHFKQPVNGYLFDTPEVATDGAGKPS